MRFELAAPVDAPARPQGIGLSALVLCAFACSNLCFEVFQACGGKPSGLLSLQGLEYLAIGIPIFALELYALWNYWKGQNWARVLVLIVSFVFAAREISDIGLRDAGLTSAMTHPIDFLQSALGAFLLYWLNTRPVKQWFKYSPPTAADLINEHLAGRLCVAVTYNLFPVQVWHLAFEHDAQLTLSCPWRIVLDENLAFASTSSGSDSSAAPGDNFDGELPQRLLQNVRVKSVHAAPGTSDLFIAFEMGIELQTWSTSPRHQWDYSDPILVVTADSAGLNSRSIAAAIPPQDSATND